MRSDSVSTANGGGTAVARRDDLARASARALANAKSAGQSDMSSPDSTHAPQVEREREAGEARTPRTLTITLPSLPRRANRTAAPAKNGRNRRREALVALAFAVVVAALAVTDTILAGRASDRSAVQAASRDAVKAAATRVPAILSYNYKTLAHDLKAAQANTTGAFHGDYQKLLATVVEPSAKSKKIINKATVTGAAVVSGDAKHVVVLVFVTQSTTSASGGTPLVSGSRVNVTMTKTHGAWLVSALNPV
jgi:Mce-associated membrane protein